MGSSTSRPHSPGDAGSDILQPSVRQARHAAALLVRAGQIPVELALEILELADHVPTMSTRSVRMYNVQAGWSGNRQSVAILQTRPIPRIPNMRENAVKRIRISTDSHDQGFSSFPQFHNTREASSSWFELALVRLPPPLPPSTPGHAASSQHRMPGSLPPSSSSESDSSSSSPSTPRSGSSYGTVPVFETVKRIRLYANLHANRNFNPHSITLSRIDESTTPSAASQENDDDEENEEADRGGGDESSEERTRKRRRREIEAEQHEMIKAVRPGDRFILYAMAQYPAWSNVVRECRIDVEMRAL